MRQYLSRSTRPLRAESSTIAFFSRDLPHRAGAVVVADPIASIGDEITPDDLVLTSRPAGIVRSPQAPARVELQARRPTRADEVAVPAQTIRIAIGPARERRSGAAGSHSEFAARSAAVFLVLLYRHCHQAEFSIGLRERSVSRHEETTLLAVEFSESTVFSEVLTRVQAQLATS
ncbi:MAG: hypothetical protein ABI809_13760, partial [Caldimonas sp.]